MSYRFLAPWYRLWHLCIGLTRFRLLRSQRRSSLGRRGRGRRCVPPLLADDAIAGILLVEEGVEPGDDLRESLRHRIDLPGQHRGVGFVHAFPKQTNLFVAGDDVDRFLEQLRPLSSRQVNERVGLAVALPALPS